MFAIALALTLAAAPLEGRGGVSTEIRKVTPDPTKMQSSLRALDVSGPFRVRIVSGDPTFVEITAEQNLLPHILVAQEKDTLVLKTDVEVTSVRGIVVVIHVPQLERVKVAGQVDLAAEMRGESIRVTASGASLLKLSGTARNARYDIKGAGKVTATDLVVDDAILVVAGACDVALFAKTTLAIEGGGVAQVRVKGKPTIKNTASPMVRVTDAP